MCFSKENSKQASERMRGLVARGDQTFQQEEHSEQASERISERNKDLTAKASILPKNN
jgi:hypothetical protein